MQRWIAVGALLALTAVSVPAMFEAGYIGIWNYQFQTWAGRQVILDLLIACSVGMFWLWRDARRHARNPWPYLCITMVAGSFGLLLYLVLQPLAKRQGERARSTLAAERV